MSDLTLPCLICGSMISVFDGTDSPSWLSQFRILYSENDETLISGVGIAAAGLAGRWIAPPQHTARWDDEGYEFPDHDEIAVLHQPPENGRYGFPFHQACWSLLECAFSPESVPLGRFYDLCKSIPIPEGQEAPDWGHAYGGLHARHPDDSRCVQVNTGGIRHHRQCVYETARLDPYKIPDFRRVIAGAPDAPPPQVTLSLSREPDCFVKLPEELCVMIASFLPMKDFLNSRLASRAFASVYYRQQFWAGKFGAGSERSWLFESKDWHKALNWRWMYKLTNVTHRPPALHNRERVWTLIQDIQQMLAPRWATPLGRVRPRLPRGKVPIWHHVIADQRSAFDEDPYSNFDQGCFALKSCKTGVPNPISRICVYLASHPDGLYVVGLKIVSGDDVVEELGYMAAEFEVPVVGRCLTGFHLAVGSRGIRAIQCIFDNEHVSRWIGDDYGTCKTMRLAASGPLLCIDAEFDGYKMVGLSAAAADWKPATLRETGLWMHDIPGLELQLHTPETWALEADEATYEPIHWCLFGGEKGSHLEWLIEVMVSTHDAVANIEFEYGDGRPDLPYVCRDLGEFPSASLPEMHHFDIDGPMGEVVTGVDVSSKWDTSWLVGQDGGFVMTSLKISTNWGRSHHFQYARPTPGEDVKTTHIVAPPGGTITGMYCRILSETVMSLGVVSEMIGQVGSAQGQQESDESDEEE